jgi:hypothetical protein
MVSLFIEIYWSVVETNLKSYWVVLNVLLKKSPISNISLIFFQLICGENENTIDHQRNNFKV